MSFLMRGATTSASPTPQGANEHDSCRTPAPNVTGKSHTAQWVLLPFRYRIEKFICCLNLYSDQYVVTERQIINP